MLLLRLWRSLLHSSRQWRSKGSATHTPPPGSQPFLVMSHVHLLGQSLRLDEDVEVGLLQLLSYHGEDSGCGTELSQVVNDELEEQLKEKAFSAGVLGTRSPQAKAAAFLKAEAVCLQLPPSSFQTTLKMCLQLEGYFICI